MKVAFICCLLCASTAFAELEDHHAILQEIKEQNQIIQKEFAKTREELKKTQQEVKELQAKIDKQSNFLSDILLYIKKLATTTSP